MLYRSQTLWILLSVLAAVFSFEFPFATAVSVTDSIAQVQIDAGSSTLLIILTVISVVLLAFTMVQYENLIRQKTLCWLGILLSTVIFLVFLKEWKNLPKAKLELTCILPALPPVFLWLAWQGIKRDRELLKKISKKKS